MTPNESTDGNDALAYKGYTGRVCVDFGAGVISGTVAGIRAVVHFEGESVAEAERAFRESVDDYLDFCRELGQTPETPAEGEAAERAARSVAA